jgi:hypothetical protein
MTRVQKFRSLEEMSRMPVLVRPDQGFESFARQCARYFALAPRAYPRGVFRFHSIEEGQAARAAVTEQNLRRGQLANVGRR